MVGPAFYPCFLLGMGLVGRQFSQVWSQSVEKTLGQANYDVVSSGLSPWEKMRVPIFAIDCWLSRHVYIDVSDLQVKNSKSNRFEMSFAFDGQK